MLVFRGNSFERKQGFTLYKRKKNVFKSLVSIPQLYKLNTY